jgi:hypothetical protein
MPSSPNDTHFSNYLRYLHATQQVAALNQPAFFPVQPPNSYLPTTGFTFTGPGILTSHPAHEAFLADSSSLKQLSHDHFITAKNECPICTENDAKATVQTQCKHVFHETCLRTWLSELAGNGQAGTCPYCRNVLFGATGQRRTGRLRGRPRSEGTGTGTERREAAAGTEAVSSRGEEIHGRARTTMNHDVTQNEQLFSEHARRVMVRDDTLSADADPPTRQGYVPAMRIASQGRAGFTRTVIFNPQLETREDASRTAAQAYNSSWTRPRPIPRPRTNTVAASARNAARRRHSIPPACPAPNHTNRARERAAEREHIRRMEDGRASRSALSSEQGVQFHRVSDRPRTESVTLNGASLYAEAENTAAGQDVLRRSRLLDARSALGQSDGPVTLEGMVQRVERIRMVSSGNGRAAEVMNGVQRGIEHETENDLCGCASCRRSGV